MSVRESQKSGLLSVLRVSHLSPGCFLASLTPGVGSTFLTPTVAFRQERSHRDDGHPLRPLSVL